MVIFSISSSSSISSYSKSEPYPSSSKSSWILSSVCKISENSKLLSFGHKLAIGLGGISSDSGFEVYFSNSFSKMEFNCLISLIFPFPVSYLCTMEETYIFINLVI